MLLYDEDGNLLAEHLLGDLSQVVHAVDLKGQKTSIESSYFSQAYSYDPVGNLETATMDGTVHLYTYDGLSQLSSEGTTSYSSVYTYDSLHNRIEKDGKALEVNHLNESGRSCDLNGAQRRKTTPDEEFNLVYDPLNRLIEAISQKRKIVFTYDPLGRRLSKTLYAAIPSGWEQEAYEDYLYDGENEIGAFSPGGHPKNLRVLGLTPHTGIPVTIGIEMENQILAPLVDVQGNIRRLVGGDARAIPISHDFTAFGEHLRENSSGNLFNPWRFASKRFDPELRLIYFGKRYYDPGCGRWLTPDPADFADSSNLYQYALNNPFRYLDPHGESVLGFVCGIVQIFAGAAIMASGMALEVITCGAYTPVLGLHEAIGFAVMTSGCAQAVYNAKNISFPRNLYGNSAEKRHTPDQEALSELVKEAGKEGVSDDEADILLDWAEECDFPARDDREKPPHWEGGKHIHLGPKHVKVYN